MTLKVRWFRSSRTGRLHLRMWLDEFRDGREAHFANRAECGHKGDPWEEATPGKLCGRCRWLLNKRELTLMLTADVVEARLFAAAR